ncbi:hypothetical protein M422DRAFT_36661 [Sphaerobolus stellatus SS14]|uniref:Uncharacterized protein n=1 Tax=Sphaerobolus stellatus (strain SS14) TaxID=990650 RepID=A0A0C9UMW1_SPHS4|nr:hypothetical protein M422DRAFT_36661 [Sphaerobolus stellatus SS14]
MSTTPENAVEESHEIPTKPAITPTGQREPSASAGSNSDRSRLIREAARHDLQRELQRKPRHMICGCSGRTDQLDADSQGFCVGALFSCLGLCFCCAWSF